MTFLILMEARASPPIPGVGASQHIRGPANPRARMALPRRAARWPHFCGSATPANFTPASDTVSFGGSPTDWGYRRFILHYAQLVAAAGGVDTFLLGAELRGLTALRDNHDAFPFVEGLCDLAENVRSVVGSATKITYGADWSEYFGHHPQDGSGDVFFHLDQLWAHPEIDAVGIDNYMPLSDWRDGDDQGGNPDGFATPYDPAGLRAGIDGGEGFDWYYASSGARNSRTRTAITDGAYGKPWVYRYKDLASWWSNPHRNRKGGVEVRRADGMGSALEADLVYRARLSGDRQGAEPAKCLHRSEIDRKRGAVFLQRRTVGPCPVAVPGDAFRALGSGQRSLRRQPESYVAALSGTDGGS